MKILKYDNFIKTNESKLSKSAIKNIIIKNKSLTSEDERILPHLLDVLNKLHSLRDRIKIRTEEVNGYWNIAFNDVDNISEHIIKELKSLRTTNTFFDFSTLVVPYNNTGKTINIRFKKEAQEFLNIKNFDKVDWKPNF